MLVKLVHKNQVLEFGKDEKKTETEQNKTLRQVEVYENVSYYSTDQIITEERQINYFMTFVFGSSALETTTINLMNYDEVYVMNDNGKTIETIRR